MRPNILVLAIVALLSPTGCRRAIQSPSPVPADVAGQVLGYAFDARTGGLGGIGRITLTLEPEVTRAFARAQLWVDSLTKFEGPARDSVDWALPNLRGAQVRVWFRGDPSTPHNDEIWAKADIIAIDALPRRSEMRTPPRSNEELKLPALALDAAGSLRSLLHY